MIVVLLLTVLNSVSCISPASFDVADVELTTIVKANQNICFYQFAKPKQTLRFEYSVIDAGFNSLDVTGSNLRITFYVRSPRKKLLFKDEKKSHGVRKYKITEPGDYEICLDNRFSRLMSKTVYFEVTIDMQSEGYRWNMINEILNSEKSNDTMSIIRRTSNKVKDNLDTIKHYQDTFRSLEARDIHLQEKNMIKVNAFSSLTTACMMLFGAFHLFILKSMFNPSSVFYKIFKRIC